MNPVRDPQSDELRKMLIERDNAIKEFQAICKTLQSENDELRKICEETGKCNDGLIHERDEIAKQKLNLLDELRKNQQEAKATKDSLSAKMETLRGKLNEEQGRILSFGGDQETIKIKIESELRNTYESTISMLKKEKDEKERDAIIYKSEIEKMKFILESKKLESQQLQKEIKERYKIQIDELSDEIMQLRESIENNKDKDRIKLLEKQNEEYRKRLADADLYRESISSKKDEAKRMIEQLQLEKTKAYDTYLTDKKDLKAEVEMLKTKLRTQEDDFKKEINAGMLANEELRSLQDECDRQHEDLRKAEDRALDAETKLNDAYIQLKEKESELELCISKHAEDDEAQMKDEREEKNILQERLEDLEKKYTELEEDRKNSLLRAESEINEIKREYSVSREEKLLINKKLMDTKDQISGLRKALEGKYEEYDQLEREYKTTQEAHRKLLDQHQKSGHERDDYLKALKDIQSQYGILFDCQKQWEKERVELHGAISELTQRLEKATAMQQDGIKASKEKLHEYKTKLRLANSKLRSYAEKISELDQAEEAF